MNAARRHLHLVPAIPAAADSPVFENPDVLRLTDLLVVVGPEPDGSVGADLGLIRNESFVRLTPAEARRFAAAFAKAADDTEALATA